MATKNKRNVNVVNRAREKSSCDVFHLCRQMKVAIFDLGGVVFDSPLAAFSKYLRSVGVQPNFFGKVVSYGNDQGSFIEFEKGLITEQEFCRKFEGECKAIDPASPVEARKIIEILANLKPRAEMLYCIQNLRKAGYIVATITNNFKFGTLEEQERRSSHLHSLFDVVVESCVLHIRKPNPEIFAHALSLIRASREDLRGATYGDCVFLDDMGVNVKAATKLGLRCIHVKADYKAAIKELQKLFPQGSLIMPGGAKL